MIDVSLKMIKLRTDSLDMTQKTKWKNQPANLSKKIKEYISEYASSRKYIEDPIF